MSLSRRAFLAGAAALSLARPVPAAAGAIPVLRAAETRARIAGPERPETAVWGYEGGTPGPVLRLRQGERLTRQFVNDLPQASTVHWHGLRIANAMDGVPDLTQAAVPPGGTFLYDFVAPDAGTYWYHPHSRPWEQMARGLYGALIVEEPAPPEVDRDEVLLVDDWRLTEQARIDESFGAMMDWSHGGRLGNWITVNGDGAYRADLRHLERLRLRLANTCNARVLPLELRGLEGWLVALDGQPLAAPEPAGRFVLAPAQRADLIVDVTAAEGIEAMLTFIDHEQSYELATFPVQGAARDARLPAPDSLPANPVLVLGPLERARKVPLLMEGGAMGGLRAASLDGRRLDIRELVEAGKVWAFNGVAGMPDEPLATASAGETLRIAMVNDTAWPHAMHLHGHHFRRVGPDGTTGPLRDTILAQPDETVEIAFVADNPGDWLLHCHMLEHAAAGMMTWLRVA